MFSSEKFPRENRLNAERAARFQPSLGGSAPLLDVDLSGKLLRASKKKRNSSVNLTYVVKIFYSLLLLLLILLFAFLHRLFSPGTPANPRPSRLDITRVNPRRKQLMNKRGARPRTIDTSAKLFASQNCLLIRRENDRL